MKTIKRAALLFAASLLVSLAIVPAVVFADVWVNGYTKSNGTYVQGHYRSNPDGNPYNNWSFPGNTNPYTGVTAGGSASSYLNSYAGSSSGYAPAPVPSYTPSYTSSYSTPYTPSTYTYTPSYTSSYEDVFHGYKSAGILFCDSGYYGKGGSCQKAPKNGYALLDSFECNYGYLKDGRNCVEEPKHSIVEADGTFSCEKGYRKKGGKCALIPKATEIDGAVHCVDDYLYDEKKNKCIEGEKWCDAEHGKKSAFNENDDTCYWCTGGYVLDEETFTCSPK